MLKIIKYFFITTTYPFLEIIGIFYLQQKSYSIVKDPQQDYKKHQRELEISIDYVVFVLPILWGGRFM
jgi:hypothetical protein